MKFYSRDFLKAWSVGLNLVFSTFIGLAIGYFLDKIFKVTFPWLTIIFLILGIISGFRDLVRLAKLQNEGPDKDDGPDKTDI